jgi:tricorn protease-like protein
MDTKVTGTLWYLDRLPIYQTTKPYIVNLPRSALPPGKRTNQVCSAYDGIRIRDIRTDAVNFSLDHHGFMLFVGLETSLRYEDFRDPTKVSDIYCKEVMGVLERMTGAETSRVLQNVVRELNSNWLLPG